MHETDGRCPTCQRWSYGKDGVPDGPFTETYIGAHTRFRIYAENNPPLVLVAQWDDYAWLSFDDVQKIAEAVK